MIDLELLAPARDAETARVAIDSGADAVYIGAGHHGARAAAGNSIEDIRSVCEYAHSFGARIYVTLNTLIYDNELDDVRQLVIDLYGVGVDALIVQDMGILKMDIPPIELHASTQCDVRTPEKARFMESVGMSQIVLPREFTLDEIRAVWAVTTVPLEVFVHGALCVSYSGDCRASFINGGRSANRGECAQMCRLPYDVYDGDGRRLDIDPYVLSLRDMNRLDDLGRLVEAGATSFKIEGRLKSVEYVRNVVLAYSSALNRIVEANPGLYRRASYGRVVTDFEPDVTKTFNRGYTNYFLAGAQPGAGTLASMRTPKHVGRRVGRIVRGDARTITINSDVELVNGDGLGFFDTQGCFVGFRANRVDGDTVFLATPLSVKPPKGAEIFRNNDKTFIDRLTSTRVRRSVGIAARLEPSLGGITLTLTDERGHWATSTLSGDFDLAKKPQTEARRATLSRLGDTVYHLNSVDDQLGDVFVPASQLTELRRRAVSALVTATKADNLGGKKRTSEKTPKGDAVYPKLHLDMHDNVANHLAEQFYVEHGAVVDSPALEVADRSIAQGELTVMTTRYCLRRELGCCLKTPTAKRIKGPLTIKARWVGARTMRVDFDCVQCRMNIIALPDTHLVPV